MKIEGLKIPRVVIAGPSSGVGKTTLVAGLAAALTRRGVKVQTFKAGPDYIDPSYLTLASGRPCRNLDTWMLSPEAVLELFARGCEGADLALIEGVMGLFDGHGGGDDAGSTAGLAKLLRAPVVLALNAGKMAASAGALVHGFHTYDPELPLAGVLINNTGSPQHLRWVTQAIRDRTGLRVLGFLNRNPELTLPERHLGLIPAAERGALDGFMERLTAHVAETVNTWGLQGLAREAPPLPSYEPRLFPQEAAPTRAVIAVAQDEAFTFYYQDNLDLLEAHGARIVPFSPLRDRDLPANTGGVYIGGGFPELFAPALSANTAMRWALRRAHGDGLPLYGECGGLMYLCQGLHDGEKLHPMVGLAPGVARFDASRRLKLAYVEMEAIKENFLVPPGLRLRGHEFHWSDLESPGPERAYQLLSPVRRREGFSRGHLLASYVHLHFGTHPQLAQRFVAACKPLSATEEGPG